MLHNYDLVLFRRSHACGLNKKICVKASTARHGEGRHRLKCQSEILERDPEKRKG